MISILILVGSVLGGVLASLFIHISLVIISETKQHYIARTIDSLARWVPGVLFPVIWICMMIGAAVMFAVTMAFGFGHEKMEAIVCYGLGIVAYLLVVPFRVTYVPLMLDRLFPSRRRSE